ncbi:unnamed protein product [Clavelina lepadiformis]|uniref:VWFA domain-containing protein n=1 Tax=Clavelina lepadiformis TaxID=159417 RepID=A0ABP0FPM4_CLALP
MKLLVIVFALLILQGRSTCCQPNQSAVASLLERFRLITEASCTRDRSNPDRCCGRSRQWGFCRGDPPVRKTQDKCPPIEEECDRQILLASSFLANFAAPQGIARASQSFLGKQSLNSQSECLVEERLSSQNNSLFRGNCNSPETVRRRRSAPVIVAKKRDLVIMMDESGSVGETKFNKLKEFAFKLAMLLCAGVLEVKPTVTRVAVMSFDQEIHLHKSLLDSNNFLNEFNYLLAAHISSIKYNTTSGKSTCLDKALAYAHEVVLDNSNGGRRGRSDVTQEIILITDGCANCGTNGLSAEQAIKKTKADLEKLGINVYVIGLGLERNCQELIKVYTVQSRNSLRIFTTFTKLPGWFFVYFQIYF